MKAVIIICNRNLLDSCSNIISNRVTKQPLQVDHLDLLRTGVGGSTTQSHESQISKAESVFLSQDVSLATMDLRKPFFVVTSGCVSGWV